MELTAATTLAALWAVSSYYFWVRDRSPRCNLATTPASRPAQLLVAYASQSGQARLLAEQYAGQLGVTPQLQAGGIELRCLSQLTADQLAQYRQVFVIASTYGQGEPPDTARRFSKTLAALESDAFSASPMQFAILALGDSAYPHFCAFGHWLHSEFARLGGHSLAPCIEVDRLSQAALGRWQSLLAWTLNCELTAQQPLSAYRLSDRCLLNPDSPNAGLYWLRLEAIADPGIAPTPQAGDLIDIHLLNGEQRTYSLANAPVAAHGYALELIVRQQYRSDGSPGHGSNYLCQRIDAGSQLKISLRRGVDWAQIPPTCPLILIGAGSGLAGVRAGLQAREQDPGGLNWLIFGERDPVYDRPCDSEFGHWRNQGLLTRLDRVWSQPTDAGSLRYVQDVLHANATELSCYLIQGGYLYVCGSAQGLGCGVHDALVELLGEAVVSLLREQGRYVRDIY